MSVAARATVQPLILIAQSETTIALSTNRARCRGLTAYALFSITCFGLFGCAGQGIDLGEFGTVSGKVTLHGTALTKGLITFNCPESGQVATAEIQHDGSYVMRLGGRDGLPLGTYKVSVRPPLPGRSQEHFRRPTSAPPPESSTDSGPEIPTQYRFETSSRLSAVVEPGDNTFDFDLTDGVADERFMQ